MEQPQALKQQNEVLDGPVAILWDIENCPVPVNVHAEDVAGNIRKAIRMHPVIAGAVTMFSAYGDFNVFPRSLREGCQRTGVKLVDVPNGRKDAADKAILVDMFLFALDNRPPSSILLISGDADFAAALHILGQRGYTIIVVIPSRSFSSALRNAGQFVWDWQTVARGEGFVLPIASVCRGYGLAGYPLNYNMGNNPDVQNLERGNISREISESNCNSQTNVNQKLTYNPVDHSMGTKPDNQNGEHIFSQANIDQMHSYSSMNLDMGKGPVDENADHTVAPKGISPSNHISQTDVNKKQIYIPPHAPGYFSSFSEQVGANPTALPHLVYSGTYNPPPSCLSKGQVAGQMSKQGGEERGNNSKHGQKQGLGFIKNQLVRLLRKFGGRMRYDHVHAEYNILCGHDLCLKQHGVRRLKALIKNKWSDTFFFAGGKGKHRLICLCMPVEKHINRRKSHAVAWQRPKGHVTECLGPARVQYPISIQNDPLSQPPQLVDSKGLIDSSEVVNCHQPENAHPLPGQPLEGQLEAVPPGEQGLYQVIIVGDGSLQRPYYIDDLEREEAWQGAPSSPSHDGA